MIVALEVPLAVNLQSRARTELETQAKLSAQTLAAQIGAENLTAQPDPTGPLQTRLVPEARAQLDVVRVLVVNKEGIVVADSDGPATLGTDYATAQRPEIGLALAETPNADIRYSATLKSDILVAAAPVLDEGHLYGAVRLTEDVAEVQANVRRITFGLAIIGFAGLSAGLIIAFALAGSFARPLTRLAAAAKRLGSGDLSTRAEDVGGAREIDELATSFDEMAARLERTVQAQREFVANASHQLRTPLTGMKLRLEQAADGADDEDLKRQLQAADLEVDRLSEIVNRLLVMAKQIEQGEPTHVDLGAAAGRALERWRERAERLGAALEVRGEGGEGQGNPSDLDQVLDNLLDNAIAYAPGPIVIESGRADGHVFLSVQDRGPGIPAEELTRVTDRFYRGKGAPAGGSGLGLAIARELTEKWGGSVKVQAPSEGGLRVEVRLRAVGTPPDANDSLA